MTILVGPSSVSPAETIVLDPAEVATGRTALDISQIVGKDGIDWGDSAIEQYLAETSRGSLPIDYRVPNREITVPLVLKTVVGLTFAAARSMVQAKAALFQGEGGWLKRTLANGDVLFVDVVGARLKLSGGWMQAHRDVDTDAVLTLEALPDFYGAEVDLGAVSETTLPELVMLITGGAAGGGLSVAGPVRGNHPGRLRLAVDNADPSNDQLGLIYGVRSRHYSVAATARLAYEAEAMTPLDTAASEALAGASGGNVVRHPSLGSNWTPVLSTDLAAGGPLTHVGSYRMFARLYSSSTGVQARLVWDVGDLTLPEENDPWTFPGSNAFYLADLGPVRLDQVPVGAHRWRGVIQGKGEGSAADFRTDRLWLVPVDEASGVLRAPLVIEPGLVAYSARDEFNQTAGALTGKTAPVGGAWAGAGDTDDFAVETTGKTAQRTVVNDANIDTGRYAITGAAMTAQAVGVDVKRDQWPYYGALHCGVLARYTDASNWLLGAVVLEDVAGGSALHLRVIKRVAGIRTVLATVQLASASNNGPTYWLNSFFSLRLVVTAVGGWAAWWFPTGAVASGPRLTGVDTQLATGGALASGKPGIYDALPSNLSVATTRIYDNFAAWVPVPDAVAFASRSAELRWDGMYREDAPGGFYGPVSHVEGDLPRLPAAGLEARPVEIIVKASRGDIDQLPDTGIDDIGARVYYRPSWMTVPG